MLLSSHARPDSGWGTMTYELCQGLSRRGGVSFELHLPRDADASELPFGAAIRRSLPKWTGSFRRHPHRLPAYLRPHINHGQVDLIHAIVEFPCAILAHQLAVRARVPFVVSAQGTYAVRPFLHAIDRWPFRAAVSNAAFVTVPAQFSADAMRSVGRVDPRFRTLANPVNYMKFQQPFDRNEARRRFDMPRDAQLILGVGALKRRKGFDVLIEAFGRVASSRSAAQMVIAGEGGERAALQMLIDRLGFGSRIRMLGYVSDADLVALYHACDIYAHLPRNEAWNFEAYGIVYLEAGACGKPVIGSRSGGVPEAIIHEQTGLLVEEDDVAGSAHALARLLDDPELARRLGAAGREFAAAHDWDWYVTEMVSLYRESIAA